VVRQWLWVWITATTGRSPAMLAVQRQRGGRGLRSRSAVDDVRPRCPPSNPTLMLGHGRSRGPGRYRVASPRTGPCRATKVDWRHRVGMNRVRRPPPVREAVWSRCHQDHLARLVCGTTGPPRHR
jgi:hypothetical protein